MQCRGQCRASKFAPLHQKGHKTIHWARRHEKHNDFPRCHLFIQPRSPPFITFCRLQQRNKNTSCCPRQLLAIWLPDVLPSFCSKFFSLPRPHCLSLILCFPLSPCPVCCHVMLQLGTVISPRDERCFVVWAASEVGLWASAGNHVDTWWCCCVRER